MRRKLSEVEMLKFWMDAEFQILHGFAAAIAFLVVDAAWQKWLIGVYLLYCVAYAAVRISAVVQQDPDYLKVPKDDPDIVRRPDGKW